MPSSKGKQQKIPEVVKGKLGQFRKKHEMNRCSNRKPGAALACLNQLVYANGAESEQRLREPTKKQLAGAGVSMRDIHGSHQPGGGVSRRPHHFVIRFDFVERFEFLKSRAETRAPPQASTTGNRGAMRDGRVSERKRGGV